MQNLNHHIHHNDLTQHSYQNRHTQHIHQPRQTKQKGSVLVVLIFLIGIASAMYFMKDSKGKNYFQQIGDKKEEALKAADNYKDIMNKRDKEIEKNL